MLKIIKKNIIFVVMSLLILQFHTYAYANECSETREIPNISEYKSKGQIRMVGMPRGKLISSVEVQLKDKGRGTAGIYADLLCHKPMENLRIWLYLEKWDDESGAWTVEDSQQFTWLAKDYPDQDLTMAVVGYDVSGLERGKDYRLRGLFGAKDLDSSLQESWQVKSEALLLE